MATRHSCIFGSSVDMLKISKFLCLFCGNIYIDLVMYLLESTLVDVHSPGGYMHRDSLESVETQTNFSVSFVMYPLPFGFMRSTFPAFCGSLFKPKNTETLRQANISSRLQWSSPVSNLCC